MRQQSLPDVGDVIRLEGVTKTYQALRAFSRGRLT